MVRVRLGLELGLGLRWLYKSPRASLYLARSATTQLPTAGSRETNENRVTKAVEAI